jgi:hypothetical protein
MFAVHFTLFICFVLTRWRQFLKLYLGHRRYKLLHLPSPNLFEANLVLFRSAEELFIEFNPSEVAFRPPVPVPKKIEPKANPPLTMHFRNEDLSNYVKEVSERHVEETVDFSLFKLSVKS